MIGTVQSVEAKVTKSGKTYYSVVIDGVKMSCWHANTAQSLKPGMEVDYVSEQKGEYTNLMSAKPASPLTGGGAASATRTWRLPASPASKWRRTCS